MKRLKEVAGHAPRPDAPRPIEPGQRQRLFAREADRLEPMLAHTPVEIIRPCRRDEAAVVAGLVDVNKTVRFRQRQRLEQDSVDQGENRGRGADAERQRGDDRDRQPFHFGERPERELEVGDQAHTQVSGSS